MMQQMQQQIQQPMNGVPMMPSMMNQSMAGMGMNQFNTNIPMGNQPPAMNSMNTMSTMNSMSSMNSMNPMNPMNTINPMNAMSSMSSMSSMNSMNSMNNLNPMNSMGSMNNMNSVGSLNGVSSLSSMDSMNSLNPMMPMAPSMNQFQQQIPMNNQFQFPNPRRMSQNSIPNGPKTKKNLKQMFNNNVNTSSAVNTVNPNITPIPQPSKKKNAKSAQPKVSIVQPPIPPQPPVSASLSSSSINTPQTSLIAPKNVQISMMNDIQMLLNSFTQHTEDRSKLFFRLFECVFKRKEERIDHFMNHVMVTMTALNPSFPTLVHALVVGMAGDSYNKLKDPPLPIIFQRVKDTKPTYKFYHLNSRAVDIKPTAKEKKSGPRVIGSFLSFNESSPPTTIFYSKEEIHPLQYATNEYFYPIISDGIVPSLMQIQFSSQIFPFLTWFIVQYVEVRKRLDILHDLMNRSGIQITESNDQNTSNINKPIQMTHSPASFQTTNPLLTSIPTVPIFSPSQRDLCIFAKTPSCKGCSFQVLPVIDEVIKNGSAKCPLCGSNIILTDLILEVKQDAVDNLVEDDMAMSYIDNKPDVLIAKQNLSDQLCLSLAPHPEDPNWEEKLNGVNGIKIEENTEPLQYATNDDFIKLVYGFT